MQNARVRDILRTRDPLTRIEFYILKTRKAHV